MIGIVDYGMGNIHSVKKALLAKGVEVSMVRTAKELFSCSKVVLPGVGAFEDAMLELEKNGLCLALGEFIEKKKIFLGICLGMQLLFESSQESPGKKGLGIFKGEVKRFSACGLKVPHMGWNQLKIVKKDCPILKGIDDGSFVYFCHSYYVSGQADIASALTEYGEDFISILWKDNCFGVQFHPEKSQRVGSIIIDNFLRL